MPRLIAPDCDGRHCWRRHAVLWYRREELAMFDVLTGESWRNAVQIEERNEKPLRIALFAVVVAWSIGILIALV